MKVRKIVTDLAQLRTEPADIGDRATHRPGRAKGRSELQPVIPRKSSSCFLKLPDFTKVLPETIRVVPRCNDHCGLCNSRFLAGPDSRFLCPVSTRRVRSCGRAGAWPQATLVRRST